MRRDDWEYDLGGANLVESFIGVSCKTPRPRILTLNLSWVDPHPVIVTIRGNGDYLRVLILFLIYEYYRWRVHLICVEHAAQKGGNAKTILDFYPMTMWNCRQDPCSRARIIRSAVYCRLSRNRPLKLMPS